MKLHWLLKAFPWALSPGIVENTGGGAVDRGDDFTPTDDADEKVEDKADEKVEDKAEEKVEDKTDDADEEKEEKDEAKDDKKKSPKRIPLDRHEALLNKEREARKEAERELAKFQSGKQVADINADLTALEAKVLGMEKEYTKLLADGEVDKATDLMRDIRRAERQMNEQRSDFKIAEAEARATERARYNISLERVEQAYPVLNPDHGDFDSEMLTDVADLKVTYERKGMTPTDALQKAVKKLLGAETTKQEVATTVTPKVDAKDVAAERKKGAVEKALDASKKTPPSVSRVGMDSDKDGGVISAKDVLKMSYKDFSALSEDQLARMRGDVI
jgi:hypothetical protein